MGIVRTEIVYVSEDGVEYKPWVHAKSGWKEMCISGEVAFWYRDDGRGDVSIALGTKMVHSTFGRKWAGILPWPGYWHGSLYGDDGYLNWHGGIQTCNIEEAIDWVRDCDHPVLGCKLWGFE